MIGWRAGGRVRRLFGLVGGRAQVELRRRAKLYLLGLPSGVERKNPWTIAEQAGEPQTIWSAGLPPASLSLPELPSAVSFRSRLVRILMAVWVIRIRGAHVPGSGRSLLRSADVLG